MKVKELLEHLDGAGLSVTDWNEVDRHLAQAGIGLGSELNEAQWTAEPARPSAVEEQALSILQDADFNAHLHHTATGIWVAEVTSPQIPGRSVWVTDSEGAEGGPFLVGTYPDADGEPWFQALSDAFTETELVDRVRRGLAESA